MAPGVLKQRKAVDRAHLRVGSRVSIRDYSWKIYAIWFILKQILVKQLKKDFFLLLILLIQIYFGKRVVREVVNMSGRDNH